MKRAAGGGSGRDQQDRGVRPRRDQGRDHEPERRGSIPSARPSEALVRYRRPGDLHQAREERHLQRRQRMLARDRGHDRPTPKTRAPARRPGKPPAERSRKLAACQLPPLRRHAPCGGGRAFSAHPLSDLGQREYVLNSARSWGRNPMAYHLEVVRSRYATAASSAHVGSVKTPITAPATRLSAGISTRARLRMSTSPVRRSSPSRTFGATYCKATGARPSTSMTPPARSRRKPCSRSTPASSADPSPIWSA